MPEPNVRARELMQASRDLARPTAADRARIQAALRARLGVVVFPLDAGSVAQAARVPWLPVSGVIVGAVLISAAVLFRFRQGPRAAPAEGTASVSVSAASSAAAAAPPPPPVAAAPSSLAVAVVPPKRRPFVAASVQDPLGQEVALLASAIGDLRTGRAGEALRFLDEHQRRFPSGVLSEDRRAARAQALCLLGRRGEAQAELDHLTPQSLYAARAAQVCAARSTTDN